MLAPAMSAVGITGSARSEAMRQWERAEIARSAVEADLTPDDALCVGPEIYRRYASPAADTPYPLEFAFHLLGDVRGKRVVDFGCGSGVNTALLANRGAHVWGIDISQDLLRLARRRMVVSGCAHEATFIAGSAHDMPFPDSSIDVVFGMGILHHLDLDLVALELLRVLKPGGCAIFQEPVRNSAVIRFLRPLVPYHAPDVSPHERPLTDEELGRFASGFSRGSMRAFVLPHVQVGRLLPVVRNYWKTLYEWDGRLLRAAPGLARYASIRVISLTK
jgi:ubiquinone/menaquinone biosynthesis C-methylase UbiE